MPSEEGQSGMGSLECERGFQYVKMPVVLERMGNSEIGKKWMS